MPVRPSSVGVEAGLQQAQRERRERVHLPAPGDRLALELVERDHRVHEAHLQRLVGLVQPAQEPDLLRLADADGPGQQAGAEAAVEAPDPGAGLAEARVVGRDREVADQVQDLAAADRVAGDHRDHRLRQPADLDVQVADVEAADALLRRPRRRRCSRRRRGSAGRRPSRRPRSPAPVKMIAPTSRSSRARENASRSSASVWGRKALRTSGRLIVILAIPSARS